MTEKELRLEILRFDMNMWNVSCAAWIFHDWSRRIKFHLIPDSIKEDIFYWPVLKIRLRCGFALRPADFKPAGEQIAKDLGALAGFEAKGRKDYYEDISH